jgi:hypothetical protein
MMGERMDSQPRTRWTDDRLDDAIIPLRPVPNAVVRLEEQTANLREALEINSDLQRERNRILVGFLTLLVVGLLAAVVTLIVAL